MVNEANSLDLEDLDDIQDYDLESSDPTESSDLIDDSQ
jgi:hypothetical protein